MYKNNLQESEVIRYLNSEIQRFHIINYLIEKYKLVNYLEIGVFKGENIREIKATHKDGVDPGAEGFTTPEVNYPMTSDEFFELLRGHDEIKYDVIFIDGLHYSEQVDKDIQNSLKHIVKGGFIVLHDCNPISYDAQIIPRETVVWNGDVWKSFVDFKTNNPTYTCCVIDTDFGVGVIHNVGQNYKLETRIDSWDYFNDNRKELLNLITVEEFKQLF